MACVPDAKLQGGPLVYVQKGGEGSPEEILPDIACAKLLCSLSSKTSLVGKKRASCFLRKSPEGVKRKKESGAYVESVFEGMVPVKSVDTYHPFFSFCSPSG